MDANRLGLIIGLLAFLLAVPLAVVANLLTPSVRDWYSTTSQKRLRRRLAQLQERARKMQTEWLFTPAEWATYGATSQGNTLIGFGMNSMYSFILVPLIVFRHDLQQLHMLHSPRIIFWGFIAMVAVSYVFNLRTFRQELRSYAAHREIHTQRETPCWKRLRGLRL
ncbi:MAG: hypothetical protein DMG97_35175 [Acidobacteria bacterium]|nr:MAG: hypothetical protein DMG97_35175 [Acidobacteriota bacterium]